MVRKKLKFNTWGVPYVFKSEEFNKKYEKHGNPAPDLWVYAEKKAVSIKLDFHFEESDKSNCAVLSPKKVKELIKLLQRTL
jgi:hypothetical protein